MPDPESGAEAPKTAVLLTVVYDSGMDERVMETLEAAHVPGWTRFFGGHGFGGVGRKEDTPIWPGTVNLLYLLLEADAAERVAAELRALQRTYRRNPGLTLWLQPVETR